MNNSHFKDPLQQIVESHLFRSNTESLNSDQMLQSVVNDYLQHLKSQGVHIPGPLREIFIQDLKEEVREMILKSTFGAIQLEAAPSKHGKTPRKTS